MWEALKVNKKAEDVIRYRMRLKAHLDKMG
jgi:hypothetical protein